MADELSIASLHRRSDAEIGELLLEPVRRGIRERVRMFPADDVRVEKSQLGDDAGVRGAVALAVQTLESP